MTVLSAQTIRRRGLVEPLLSRRVHPESGCSYGLSCAGVDVRIRETIWVWPLWGRLASTIEHFSLPPDLIARVHDKSSNARQFVTVQNTVGEPGWRGYLTLEITRHLPWPKRIRAGTPIAQVMFELLDEPTEQPYGEGSKYQDQPARPVPARREVA